MRLIISILILLFPFVATAQTVTKGRVSDASTSEALIGANIYVKSDWQKGASTDVNGEFSIKGLVTGDTLVISYIGYDELLYRYNGEKELQIRLNSSATSIDEVIITAEKLVAEEFTYKKVKRLDIYLNPSAKADPLLAVNSLPSSTTLDESANVSFRGSSPGETGVFVNNAPLYDFVRFSQLNGIGTFGIFNTAMVDELLVFPGNPPLEYGNTTSGLIAIKTTEKVPEEEVKNVTVSLASYGFLISQPINKKQSITAFSNYQPAAIIKAINSEALNAIEDFNSIDLGLSYLNILNDNTILKVFNYSLLEGYDFNLTSPTLNTLFQQRKKRNFTITNLRRKIGNSEITFNNNISFSNSNFRYADTDIELNNFDGFGSLNYLYTQSKMSFKSGIALDYREQHFDGTFYTIDYAEGPGFPTASSRSTTELIRPEMYAYLTYYASDKWTFGGGLRKNIPTKNQDDFLSSQVSSKYSISETSSLTFGLGNYHRYDFANEGGSVLNESKQVSLDYSYSKSGTTLQASVYAKNTVVNSLESDITGLELFVRTKIANKLRGQLSYSIIDGTSKNSEGVEFPNAFDLDYFVRGNLEWRLNANWTFNSTFSFRQGNYYQPFTRAVFEPEVDAFRPEFSGLTNQSRLPDYGTIDISLSRMIPISEKVNIIAFGTMNNILNRENIRTYTYNFDYSERSTSLFSQRTVYFGAVINF